jgi:hypothetical protein
MRRLAPAAAVQSSSSTAPRLGFAASRGVSSKSCSSRWVPVASSGAIRQGATRSLLFSQAPVWFSGGDGDRETVTRGDVVIWEPGEDHESGSDEGMTAIVVEAEELDGLMDGAPTWSNVSLSDVAAGPCPVPGTGRGRGRPV